MEYLSYRHSLNSEGVNHRGAVDAEGSIYRQISGVNQPRPIWGCAVSIAVSVFQLCGSVRLEKTQVDGLQTWFRNLYSHPA